MIQMAVARISRRHGIKWTSEDYSEPSSTIVLSSQSGQFVDIRLGLKSSQELSNPEEDSIALPFRSRFEDNSIFEELEWAIAGQASWSDAPGAGKDQRHGRWTHWIDSRTVEPDADEGGVQQLKNGADLELGLMRHSTTKILTAYREIWISVPLRIPPAPVSDQGGTLSPAAAGKRSHAVIKLDAPAALGLVILVAQFCQGIVRIGHQVACERWQYDFDAKAGLGEWVRTFRQGDLAVPCGYIVMEAEKLQKGAELSVPDIDGSLMSLSAGNMPQWIVVEEDFT